MSSDPQATGPHSDPRLPADRIGANAANETAFLPNSVELDTVSQKVTSATDTDATLELQAADAERTGDFSCDPDATAAFASTGERIPSTRNRISIPGYRILGELGRGAMGVVYKAHQLRADRSVALKVMLHSDHAQSEEAARFTKEAQSAARLQHPNIVQIYEVGEAGETPYFTLEFVEGGTLARRMAKQMLTTSESAKMMLTLSQAMAYAHQRGVIHRDLKPANILVTNEGAPKIADFGLARRTDDVSHLTIDGTILGTPNYMSPEQASGKQAEIGPLSDVYTLGAILYEMLTGRPPFKGASAWEVIQQVRTAEPMPPSTLQPGIARDLETICFKCLQKEPEKRYGSAQLLADDLQRFLNNEPILARPIGSVERIIRLCKRYPREARLIGLVAALMLLMTLGATATAYRINQDRKSISQQRDQIKDQRDEISKEKDISDQRLTTYRTTVSELVNRAPNLLQDAPLGAGTREEFIKLIRDILDRSEDTGAVGPSRQWGLEAIALRQGEDFLSQAAMDLSQSDRGEDAARKLQNAADKFSQAEKIAQEIYDQKPEKPEDTSKAASNLAVAISKKATTSSLQDAPLQHVAPLFQQAIKLRRESLAALEAESKTVAIRQAELGAELARYGDYLLTMISKNNDPIKFATRATEISQEAVDLVRQAIDVLPKDSRDSQAARQDLGMAFGVLARAAVIRGLEDQAKSAFEESAGTYQTLSTDFPNRFTFRKLMVESANAYGDYLLGKKADPKLIEQQYSIAIGDLKRTFDSPELRTLLNGFNGLAMQFYRLGTVSRQRGESAKAKEYFERCGLLREMAWQETIQNRASGDHENSLDSSITQRIELMLAKARCGHVATVREHAPWLADRAEQTVEANGNEGRAGIYEAKYLFLQAAAAYGMLAEHLPAAEQDETLDQAMRWVERAINTGFSDVTYLRQDPDLDALQKLDRYQQLLASKFPEP